MSKVKAKAKTNEVSIKLLNSAEYEALGYPISEAVFMLPIKDNCLLVNSDSKKLNLFFDFVGRFETDSNTLVRLAKEQAGLKLSSYKWDGVIETKVADEPAVYHSFFTTNEFVVETDKKKLTEVPLSEIKTEAKNITNWKKLHQEEFIKIVEENLIKPKAKKRM